MIRSTRPSILIAGLVFAMALTGSAEAGFDTFVAAGNSTPGSILGTVTSFQAALGNPNNGNAPGPISGGRREINWDGGGATNASPTGPSMDVFLNTRGALSTTPGTGFQQTPVNDPALTSINPTYATTFTAFSPIRIFTPLGSNITDVTFFQPGTNGGIPATVAGFGAVFSDVDILGSTRMDFFSLTGSALLSLNALPGLVANGSLSFVGALANAGEQIGRVRITTGTTALGPTDNPAGGVDVVVMDDFLYSEPVAVPEPAGLILLSLGMVGTGLIARRRKAREHAH
jgi:hypothetical protein